MPVSSAGPETPTSLDNWKWQELVVQNKGIVAFVQSPANGCERKSDAENGRLRNPAGEVGGTAPRFVPSFTERVRK
jgi:hypothetical protein